MSDVKPVPPPMSKEDKARAAAANAVESPAMRFLARLQLFIHPKGVEDVMKLKMRPDDVVLLTPPKCGTTWAQMILHQMRSGGDLEFDALDIECPYMEAAYGLGVNIHKDQRFSPRIFKTHLIWKFLPKGGKVIFLIRDPVDAGISFYHFTKDWYFSEEEDGITADFYLKNMWSKMRDSTEPQQFASIWHHYIHAYEHRKDPNVLWLHYEDMIENISESIKLIANFVGINVDNPEFFEMIKERSSMAYMKKFPEKFDIHEHKLARNPYLGLPADAGLNDKNKGLVRAAGVGGIKGLAPETIEVLNQKWAEVCEPVLGFKSYNEMRFSINKELGRPFQTLEE